MHPVFSILLENDIGLAERKSWVIFSKFGGNRRARAELLVGSLFTRSATLEEEETRKEKKKKEESRPTAVSSGGPVVEAFKKDAPSRRAPSLLFKKMSSKGAGRRRARAKVEMASSRSIRWLLRAVGRVCPAASFLCLRIVVLQEEKKGTLSSQLFSASAKDDDGGWPRSFLKGVFLIKVPGVLEKKNDDHHHKKRLPGEEEEGAIFFFKPKYDGGAGSSGVLP